MEDHRSPKTTVGQKIGHQLRNSLNELENAFSEFDAVATGAPLGGDAGALAGTQSGAANNKAKPVWEEQDEMLAELRKQLAELGE